MPRIGSSASTSSGWSLPSSGVERLSAWLPFLRSAKLVWALTPIGPGR